MKTIVSIIILLISTTAFGQHVVNITDKSIAINSGSKELFSLGRTVGLICDTRTHGESNCKKYTENQTLKILEKDCQELKGKIKYSYTINNSLYKTKASGNHPDGKLIQARGHAICQINNGTTDSNFYDQTTGRESTSYALKGLVLIKDYVSYKCDYGMSKSKCIDLGKTKAKYFAEAQCRAKGGRLDKIVFKEAYGLTIVLNQHYHARVTSNGHCVGHRNQL